MNPALLSIPIKVLDPFFYAKYPLPTYSTQGSAAMDLRAAISETVEIAPQSSYLFPTALAIHIGDPEKVGLIFPRSGLGHKHGLVLGNLTGVIDADYPEEIKVSIWNRSMQTYKVLPGERIAQLMIIPIQRVQWQQVDSFQHKEGRSGGFGHSGRM